ncbi:hypothetical protein ACHAXT_001466 [Thalassiosira profunda]
MSARDEEDSLTVAVPEPLTAFASQLRSYGSCPSLSTPRERAQSPTHLLASFLMASPASAELEESSLVATEAADLEIEQAPTDATSLAGETIEVEGESDDEEEAKDSPLEKMVTMLANNRSLSPLVDRLLHQRVAANRLAQYPLLEALSQNGRYAAVGFLGAYLVVTIVIWIPLWLLAQLITEGGVYLLILTSIVYGGRCLLRLLAFPGTNVRVYGEIETEFAKYSCRMLEGAAGAVEDFAKSICAAGSKSKAGRILGDDSGWEITDVPATHKRLMVYKDRVLGVYWEVLHCLLEEGGRGFDPSPMGDTNGSSDRNGFYRLGENISACKDTCKRNLCCERKDTAERSSGDIEGVDMPRSPISGSLGDKRALSNYANNPLVGDIGNMGNLTAQARSDGREMYTLLTMLLIDLSALESSSSNILRVMEDKGQLKNATASPETMQHATKLMQHTRELRELISRIKLSSETDNDTEDEAQQDEEAEMGAEAVRNRLEEQGTAAASSSAMGVVWSALQAFANMIDPPPHKSIFGLDVIRGTFLTRYRGARQFWVKRNSGGGKLDVILIPSPKDDEKSASAESLVPLSPRKGREDVKTLVPERDVKVDPKRKAVLYCNPNAGLVEVATGMGLIGGNVHKDGDDDEADPTCWTELYIENGYDVYLFNYAGYGRSYGGGAWNEITTEYSHGVLGVLKRVLFSTFLAFKPSSESLKADAATVAQHIADVIGVDELILHGESIGGMAAAGAARVLTTNATAATPKPSTLLICDRTFSNLEAVAQRLVGQWTGNAIRLLTPSWSTDVARDFLAAKCPKIVGQDAADEIIHDYSSLKVGLSFAGELTKGQTKNVGWMMSPPVEIRLADVDNVSIANSRIAGNGFQVKSPPTWPADKRLTWSEAYHFAACVKRIGKLATIAKKQMQRLEESVLASGEAEGIELLYSSDQSPPSLGNRESASLQTRSRKTLIKLWSSLACCDGLCGHPLGHAVKEGFDCTVAWLCCAVVFGGQVLAEKAEKRWDEGAMAGDSRVFLSEDFDSRPKGYEWDEDDLTKHPVPIPELIASLKEMSANKNALSEVESELSYVIGMLEYVVARLTSKENSALSSKRRNGQEDEPGVISTGCFLNLHCGHNNQYSTEEREKLLALIRRAGRDR